MAKSEVRGLYDDRRKLIFLKHLALTSNVARSAKEAGIAVSTVYDWRTKIPEFYDAWMTALAEGYALLETELLDRARNGTPREVFYHGRKIATVHEYDNAMALRLFFAHQKTVARTRAQQAQLAGTAGDVRRPETLDEKLMLINRRLKKFRKQKNGFHLNGAAPDHPV